MKAIKARRTLLITGTLLNFALCTTTMAGAQSKPVSKASKPMQNAQQKAAQARDQQQKVDLAAIKNAEQKAQELLAQEKADPTNAVLQQNTRQAFHQLAIAMSNYGDKYVPLQKTLPSLQHTYLTGRYYELSGNAPAAIRWYAACQKSPLINAPTSVWEGTPLSQLVKEGLARAQAAEQAAMSGRSTGVPPIMWRVS
jgi:hypothetical protein